MNYENRNSVPEKYKWNLCDLFATREDWEKAIEEFTSVVTELTALKGKLHEKAALLKFKDLINDRFPELGRIYAYSFLMYDLDTKDADAQACFGKARAYYGKFLEAISFVNPELAAMDEDLLKSYIDDKDLDDIKISLETAYKSKAHTLSEAEEMLLAGLQPIVSGFQEAFGRLDNGDLDFGSVTVDGKEVKITHGMYGMLLQNRDQKVREATFKTYYKAYINHINTIASLYSSSVQYDWYAARTRKFESVLDRALFSEDVDKKVYTNLINSTERALPPLHDYILLKKQLLGVETLNMYDLYVPVIEDAEINVDFDEAFKIVKEGLKVLGDDYQELLDRAYNERWMDVYETPNKRSGAYSLGIDGAHPYVLLNYRETTESISTIAHELGHAMHSYYSCLNQKPDKSDYKIFVAEVASTCNEILLLKHLMKTSDDVGVKKYLMTRYLDMLRTTMFRQTMFAEFEYNAHTMVEKDETLTYENMCKMYLELNKKYYGEHVNHNDEIAYEWSRIPHFYRPFYVYKYATGIISAICLAEKMLAEGEPAVANYKKFLTLGCSLDPVSELKIAGVDLTSTEPFDIVAKSFATTLKELRELCGK